MASPNPELHKGPGNPVTIDIEKATIQNNNYREVIYTGKLQLVLMSLSEGEEIGYEVHPDHDQFIRVEAGIGFAVIADKTYQLKDGAAVVIPAGIMHNIINLSAEKMKLYTIYSPSEHPPDLIQQTKPNHSI